MSSDTVIIQPADETALSADVSTLFNHTDWLDYFSPERAIQEFEAHLRTLPSWNSPEQHTAVAYRQGLKTFFSWSKSISGDPFLLPTRTLIKAYIAYLRDTRGLKARTIITKYIPALNHYLDALSYQQVSGDQADLMKIMIYREHIRAAQKTERPRPDQTTGLSDLYAYGHRLTREEVNSILRSIDRTTRQGARDYAMLLTAFYTALRAAELRRITLNSIRQEDNSYVVVVRGKRNNFDPVPIAAQAVAAIQIWVERYNADLPHDDPRRIGPDTPVWQGLTRSSNYLPLKKIIALDVASVRAGTEGTVISHDATTVTVIWPDGLQTTSPIPAVTVAGMHCRSLSKRLEQRCKDAGITKKLGMHDTRRTAAALAARSGMPRPAIRKMMRHKSAEVTERYIGDEFDYSESNLQTYVVLG